MEEIGATIPIAKYQQLRVLWRPLCDYTRDEPSFPTRFARLLES